jgi:hypothetical protein
VVGLVGGDREIAAAVLTDWWQIELSHSCAWLTSVLHFSSHFIFSIVCLAMAAISAETVNWTMISQHDLMA